MYQSFTEIAPATGTATASAQSREEEGRFSALEWLVIGLAERDGLASLSEPSALARALRSLFGLGTRSRLADERLERLRRLAVLVWHRGWDLPKSELRAFLGEFSIAQLETLLASIGKQKAAARPRRIAA